LHNLGFSFWGLFSFSVSIALHEWQVARSEIDIDDEKNQLAEKPM